MSTRLKLPHGVEAHVHAQARLGADSELLCEVDIGPLGSDRGHDAFVEFLRWRDDHPRATLGAYVAWTCEGWVDAYASSLATPRVIEAQLEQEEAGEFDFGQEVYTLDETLIAAGLAQLLTEGRIDDDGRPALAIAVARQAHPLVIARHFGDAGAAEQRRRAIAEAGRLLGVPVPGGEAAAPLAGTRLLGFRIYAPGVKSEDGPPTDPEVKVKEILEGGERPGGAIVASAGKAHLTIVDALFWALWEVEFRVPGFEEIYFLPTTRLAPGTYDVEYPGHRRNCMRHIRVGVEPERLRAICRGTATADGVDLFGGAVVALAARYGLDPAPVDAARAKLARHGLDFEALLIAKRFDGYELRAYLELHGRRADQRIVLEHFDGEATRRGCIRHRSRRAGYWRAAHDTGCRRARADEALVGTRSKTRAQGDD